MEQAPLFDALAYIEGPEEDPRYRRLHLTVTCTFAGPANELWYHVRTLDHDTGELVWQEEAQRIALASNVDELASRLSKAVERIMRQLDTF